MSAGSKLWIRHEVREFEYRTALTPGAARELIAAGASITVEESDRRCFGLAEYLDAGCAAAPAGSWVSAPPDSYILGLKALPDLPRELVHRHIFFGHAFKGQPEAAALLRRFGAGAGELLDLEYLVDDQGRRLAAFGYWAGYLGAALAVLQYRGAVPDPLRPTTKAELEALLAPRTAHGRARPTAVVIGALGRCGSGARDALAAAGIAPTCWDVEETRRLDRAELLRHDILVNAVYAASPGPVFLTPADLDDPARRLSVIADVACDVGSDCNVLPIYQRTTTWEQPSTRLRDGRTPLDLIAIDNLPSLLPAESSSAFSALLSPLLARLSPGPSAAQEAQEAQEAPEWRRCAEAFRQALAEAEQQSTTLHPQSKEHVDA